jgi:hypothetical protein
MGDALLANNRLRFEEYESLEAFATDYRFEFNEGEIWSLADETIAHNQIVQNIAFFLRGQFHVHGCRVFVETIRLEVAAQHKYYYPDVFLTCFQCDLSDPRPIHEPVLVVEVLSDSTESNDFGKKVDAYLSIPCKLGGGTLAWHSQLSPPELRVSNSRQNHKHMITYRQPSNLNLQCKSHKDHPDSSHRRHRQFHNQLPRYEKCVNAGSPSP